MTIEFTVTVFNNEQLYLDEKCAYYIGPFEVTLPSSGFRENYCAQFASYFPAYAFPPGDECADFEINSAIYVRPKFDDLDYLDTATQFGQQFTDAVVPVSLAAFVDSTESLYEASLEEMPGVAPVLPKLIDGYWRITLANANLASSYPGSICSYVHFKSTCEDFDPKSKNGVHSVEGTYTLAAVFNDYNSDSANAYRAELANAIAPRAPSSCEGHLYVFRVLRYELNGAEPSGAQISAFEESIAVADDTGSTIEFQNSIVSLQSGPGLLATVISVNIVGYLETSSFQYIDYLIDIQSNECYPIVVDSQEAIQSYIEGQAWYRTRLDRDCLDCAATTIDFSPLLSQVARSGTCPLSGSEEFLGLRLHKITLEDGTDESGVDMNWYRSDQKASEHADYPLWLDFTENELTLQAASSMTKGCYVYDIRIGTFPSSDYKRVFGDFMFAFEVIVLEQSDSTELEESICTGIPVIVSPENQKGQGDEGESDDLSQDFASVVKEVADMLGRTVSLDYEEMLELPLGSTVA